MDSEKVKKKFFDISPPTAPVGPPSAPTVPKRQMITINEQNVPPPMDDPLLDSKASQTHKASDLAPLPPVAPTEQEENAVSSNSQEDSTPVIEEPTQEVSETTETEETKQATVEVAEAPAVNPLAEAKRVEIKPIDSTLKATQEIEEKETPVSEQYAVSDALPDPSETAANAIKSSMQEPKIYDTTAYHIPIKNYEHGHGGTKMAFLFGALFAIIVVAGVVYAMVQLGS